MAGPLQLYQPDVILLLGGTNDVTWSGFVDPTLTVNDIAGRLDSLLSDLYTYRPTATVFVGTIPPAATSADGTLHSALSAQVNALFPDVLATHSALGQSVHLVDLRSLLTPADLADELHPSPAGYAKIGQAWFEAIEAAFPPPPPPPPETVAWTNASGGLFSDGANWNAGAAPLAGQSVVFDLASAYTVTFETDTASKRLVVRNDDVTFDLASFFYNLSESAQPSVVVGEQSGNIAKLTITHGHLAGTSGTIGAAEGSTGQVTVGAEGTWTNTQGLAVGGGTGLLIVQSGGSVTVGTTLDVMAGGTVHLEDGTITASTMNVAGGTVTVTSGVLGLSAGLLSVSGGGTLNLDGGALNATLVNSSLPGDRCI